MKLYTNLISRFDLQNAIDSIVRLHLKKKTIQIATITNLGTCKTYSDITMVLATS